MLLVGTATSSDTLIDYCGYIGSGFLTEEFNGRRVDICFLIDVDWDAHREVFVMDPEAHELEGEGLLDHISFFGGLLAKRLNLRYLRNCLAVGFCPINQRVRAFEVCYSDCFVPILREVLEEEGHYFVGELTGWAEDMHRTRGLTLQETGEIVARILSKRDGTVQYGVYSAAGFERSCNPPAKVFKAAHERGAFGCFRYQLVNGDR